MAPPITAYSNLLPDLRAYLTAECAPFDPVVWNWYTDNIAPNDPPRGFASLYVSDDALRFLDNFNNTSVTVALSLLVASGAGTFGQLETLAIDWQVAINAMMRKLCFEGYNNRWSGIRLQSTAPIQYYKDQNNDGGYAQLKWIYSWSTDGILG
jgi:hypothetical protein